MKKLLLLLSISFLLISCNNPASTTTVINEVILITINNDSYLSLKVYQGEYLTNVPQLFFKDILCEPGIIEVIPEGQSLISFSVRNNKTYTYKEGVITEGD